MRFTLLLACLTLIAWAPRPQPAARVDTLTAQERKVIEAIRAAKEAHIVIEGKPKMECWVLPYVKPEQLPWGPR